MENEDRSQQAPKPKYECLLFDVDDTLYPISSGFLDNVHQNIREFMINKLGIEEDKVDEMDYQLEKDYGTTMAGLRAFGYDFDYDDYHSFVYGRLPFEDLEPDAVLKGLLQSLPIRKVIFSNENKDHIAKVLGRLGLEDCFEEIICFETLNPVNKSNRSDAEEDDGLFSEPKPCSNPSSGPNNIIDNSCEPGALLPRTPIVCKPSKVAFEQALKIANINPQKTLFFDDTLRNLQTGKLMGLHTVLVDSSRRTKSVDYAIQSIHDIMEVLEERGKPLKNMKFVACKRARWRYHGEDL